MGLFSGKSDSSVNLKAQPLDKDLKRIVQLEHAAKEVGTSPLSFGLGLLFLIGVWVFTYVYSGGNASATLIAAAVIGGYMAINIGANDVANNVGPAVGSKALTMFGALAIAAIFEAAGALIAGGEVVSTISKGIISTNSITDVDVFVWAMMSALLSAALWVNLATVLGGTGIDDPFDCRRGDGGGDRRRRTWRGPMDRDGGDCRELGHITDHGRHCCGRFSDVHQNCHSVQAGQGRSRA